MGEIRSFPARVIGRRSLLAGLAGASLAAAHPEDSLGRLEQRMGGRLGVCAIDTGSGRRLAWRSDERFPMASTFKVMAVAALLARVDRGAEGLERRVPIRRADLLPNSPASADHVGGAMSLAELCAAALKYSDNTAANAILAALGGPPAVTAYARSLGDAVTRLDRTEPALNAALPGDARDTTTPAAMAVDLQRLLLGSALSAPSRARLRAWMTASVTGDRRLRAGLPATWRAIEKTGTGRAGSTNDIGVLWPSRRAPIAVAVYYAGSLALLPERESVIAQAAGIIAAQLSRA